MDDFIILIPAYNPPKEILSEYLEKLHKEGFTKIVIVNDGSRDEYIDYFDSLKNKGFDIFTHQKNLGKGRALKNAFNYILNTYTKFRYIVTVDSDGQHSVEDVINIINVIKDQAKSIMYLGARNFSEKDVPFKSSFGNKSTSFFYKVLFHDKIQDTQTGLRFIPKDFIIDFIDLDGERFEYEINMLINCSRTGKEVVELPISTLYFDNNSESHFNPIKDSFKIYKVMFKSFFNFILSSLFSFVIDIISFTLLLNIFEGSINSFDRILIATALARIISGIFNYKLNKNFVFKDDNKDKTKVFKYMILWLIQLFLSAYLVEMIIARYNLSASLIKIIVDMFIFIVSFNIQNKHIFNNR